MSRSQQRAARLAAEKPDGEPPSFPVSALASDNGRAWLAQHLLEAEEAERSGPDGQGWQYNEALRDGITEHAEFLRALVALISPLVDAQP